MKAESALNEKAPSSVSVLSTMETVYVFFSFPKRTVRVSVSSIERSLS